MRTRSLCVGAHQATPGDVLRTASPNLAFRPAAAWKRCRDAPRNSLIWGELTGCLGSLCALPYGTASLSRLSCGVMSHRGGFGHLDASAARWLPWRDCRDRHMNMQWPARQSRSMTPRSLAPDHLESQAVPVESRKTGRLNQSMEG